MNALFRAPFKPSTIDEATRTVDLLASTGAGIVRADYEGPFTERLDVSPKAVDLIRLDGMPLLDTHRQDGLDRVLGQVVGARFEGGNLIVRVQFSARAEAIWQDVKAGIIRNVSIGYAPQKIRDSHDAKGARIRTVTQWELREVSLVPVGADPAAKVRSDMTDITTADVPAPEIRATTQSQPTTMRAAVNVEIRALATTFDLGSDWANGLIDRGASEGEARAAALAELGTRQSTRPVIAARSMSVGAHDDPTQVRALISDALYARHTPGVQLAEAARPFAHMTAVDVAKECLRMAGVSTTGMAASEVVSRALSTTSDFPSVFANTANRTLREAYTAAPNVLKSVARPSTAKDFRAKYKVQAADMAKLQKVNEAGEYKYSTFIDAKESYSIGTYGTIVALSRQMIINDDIGAFLDIAAKLGIASAEFEAQFLVNLLISNSGLGPIMDGGTALFDATHGNLSTAVTALDQDGLTSSRLAMRRQTGINGRPIAVTPKYLLVPPELETAAEINLTRTQPNSIAGVNPFGGKLEILVEQRLTDTASWYVVGDPALIDGLEYSYLQGFEGPQTESRAGFEVDGVEVKVRLDYGAAFIDWRNWYKNKGS